MDVKKALKNGYLKESIHLDQPERFNNNYQEQKVCKLLESIYGLMKASRAQDLRFDDIVNAYGFEQNVDEPCVSKLIKSGSVVFLVLYKDDI